MAFLKRKEGRKRSEMECVRCGHKWVPQKQFPMKCPACSFKLWNWNPKKMRWIPRKRAV